MNKSKFFLNSFNATNRKITSSRSSKVFWEWTTKERPSWKSNIIEALIVCSVFGVTGTSSMLLIRPALKHTVGLEGSFVEGPNSYRVASLFIISPCYAILLITLGTISGRHLFFARMAFKILGRFIPKSMLTNVLCTPAKLKIIK
jgi:hypothetical protein